ncbi:MAG: N-acetyltransferase [Pseudomonadota bacterium]
MNAKSKAAASAAQIDMSAIRMVAETPDDLELVTQLHEEVFGPGRFAKTAFRLREGKQPRYDLSRLAWRGDQLLGAVRMTGIAIGDGSAVLLGPLCVRREIKGMGLGRALMKTAMEASWSADETVVLLVGDAAYYSPFGFQRAVDVELPGPADPARTLIAVRDGSPSDWSGKVA